MVWFFKQLEKFEFGYSTWDTDGPQADVKITKL